MKRSVISSLALTAAMLLSTGAWAQDATMIGQQSISADDLPKVQAQCATLAGVEGGSLLNDTTEDASTDSANSTATDETSEEKTEPNGADKATATINLDLITLEECKAAGLAK